MKSKLPEPKPSFEVPENTQRILDVVKKEHKKTRALLINELKKINKRFDLYAREKQP